MFSLDINNTLLLSRLILSFLVFLLIYAFVFLVSKKRIVALCATTVLLFADSVLSYSGLSRFLYGISPDSFLQLARPINPAMVYLLFFGFLVSFLLFYQKKDWRWGLVSTIILGLNFYNYFYSWTFLYAFGGFLGLIFLIQRKWQGALRIASVFIGALFLAIPFSLNLYLATLYPTYEEVSVRFGVICSHFPLFIGVVALLAIVVFLLGFPKEDKEKYFFCLSLLLAPLVTMNQQILTGKVLQVSHYHWFFHKPIAVIIVIIILFYFLESRGLVFYKKALVTFIIVISVFTGVFVQTVSYFSDSRDGGNIAIERQKYGPVMKWLSDNAEKEAVVFANDEASHLTVIYTPLNVFYHRAAIYSLSATKMRLLEVLFTFYRLRGVSAKEAQEVFLAESGYISSNIYGMHYRELLGSYEAIPDEKIEEISALYRETLSISTSKWLEQTWGRYGVEYLVWNKKADPLWDLEKYSFLKKVATFGNIAIYKFIQ